MSADAPPKACGVTESIVPWLSIMPWLLPGRSGQGKAGKGYSRIMGAIIFPLTLLEIKIDWDVCVHIFDLDQLLEAPTNMRRYRGYPRGSMIYIYIGILSVNVWDLKNMFELIWRFFMAWTWDL